MPRNYPSAPAVSAALKFARSSVMRNAFGRFNLYTGFTDVELEMADRFDVAKELEEALKARRKAGLLDEK